MEDDITKIVDRLSGAEQNIKSNQHRIDECDAELKEQKKEIKALQETNSILKNVDYRIGNMEKSVEEIKVELKENGKEKGKKYDKLIEYIFFTILSILLGYIAIKLGLK